MDLSGKIRAGLLTAGAMLGVAAALAAILSPGDRYVPADAIAVVNGQPISRADLDLALAAVGNDRRNILTEPDHSFVLARLIEEELLMQKALDLGLARSDRALRNSIVRALIDSVASYTLAEQPDEKILRGFFAGNQTYFEMPAQVQLVHLFAAADDTAAQQRLETAHLQLRKGHPLGNVQTACECQPPLVLPATPVSEPVLRRLLSPLQVDQVLRLEAGQVSDVMLDLSGHHVFILLQRVPAKQPAYEDVRDRVLDEWRHRSADDALRTYLKRLWRQADIDLADDAPEPEPGHD